MADFDTFLTSIRQEPSYGKACEAFVKWFLQNDPEWSTQVDEVWQWEEWPDRWGPDCGIDLVFRHRNGEIWAVQAKCYDPSSSISKKSIDSFLSESGRSVIDKRLLIASTDRISANAKRVCTSADQDKSVTLHLLKDFQAAAVDYPETYADLPKAGPKAKPIPHDHQLEAIDAVEKGFETHDRGQLIMACGTGKTFTTLWVKERLNAKSTLVLVPSLNLLSQTMREWTWASKEDIEVLNVCSDKSVGRQSEDMSTSDAPFPVTSEVAEIAAFLNNPTSKVVFCTYQSSNLIAQAHEDADVPAFDLAIADETHRCAGKADAGFATILDGEKIRSEKRLFTTATPRIFGKSVRDAAKARDVKILSMDDPDVFGPELHRLTFGEAIERDLLTNYQVVIVGVDEPMVAEWIDQGELLQFKPDMHTDARSLAAKIALIKAIRDYDLQRMISFHSRVNAAKQFSQEVSDIIEFVPEVDRPSGSMWSDYVSGAMPTGERTRKIGKLKTLEDDQRGILTNARCLSEGVDVPALDGVAFIDPRGSQVDIIQAVGRAIRRSKGKKVGTIVLPVFLESADNAEEQIEQSAFKPVWDVLKALRSHDEVLADELDSYRTEMGRKGAAKVEIKPEQIVFDLPHSVEASFSNALSVRLVEETTASWEFWYGLLRAFCEREGHSRVPQSYKDEGLRLGSWVSNQRSEKEKLGKARVRKLEALVGWVWEANESKWQEGFRHVEEFAAKEGHARVPRPYKTEDGFPLGTWVGSQRGKRDKLAPERLALLASCPGWVWNLQEWQWEVGFSHLKAFVDENGNADVPQRFLTNDRYRLGSWVNKQRLSKESLSKRQVEKLESINGWKWSLRDQAWNNGFDHLVDYAKSNHDVLVPVDYICPNGFALGRWVVKQRYNKPKLSPEKKAKLESVEGWAWNARDAKFEANFSQLMSFYQDEGHCRVPVNMVTESGFRIGEWVANLRRTRDKLSDRRKKRLDAMGFVWNASNSVR
jgi:superfamily II DNA or RNA helicase